VAAVFQQFVFTKKTHSTTNQCMFVKQNRWLKKQYTSPKGH